MNISGDKPTKWWRVISNTLQRSRGGSKHRAFTRNTKGQITKRRTKKLAAKRARASRHRQNKA